MENADVVKLIKVKKPLKENDFNAGFRIVAVSEELAEIQLSKSNDKRNTQWKGVEIATLEDIKKYGRPGETLEIEEHSSASLQTKEQEKDDTREMLELVLKENEELKAKAEEAEELKKRIAELEKSAKKEPVKKEDK